MKKIPNLQFTIPAGNPIDPPAKAADLIRLVLNQPPTPTPENPTGGFTFAEMRARGRIADALDKLKPDAAEIQLEDADFKKCVECVRDYRGWRSPHPDVLKFGALFGL